MIFKEIYLDNGATTKIDPEVLKKMMPYLDNKYGNSSTIYSLGIDAREALDKSRSIIAKSIGAKLDEIFFTSGGTESNNLAIKGIAFANKEKGNHIIITKIEHKSVLNCCKWLETLGFKVTYLDVDEQGFVNPKELKKAITNKTILVSIIHGHNEIGTIQNLEELGKICKEHDVYFHTDACQSYTKTELNVNNQFLDLISLNAHKIHGPKGIGALYIRKGTKITPWQHGGDQEGGLRSGTENIHGVVGFAEAVKIALYSDHIKYITKLRDKLIKGILQIPNVKLNGPTGEKRLCNNTNFSLLGIEGEAIGGYLDQEGICSSTGSACSTKMLEPSYVLKAIGLNHEEANGSLRLTLSRFNTEEEIDCVLKIIPEIVEKLRRISPIKNVLTRNN